MRRLTLFALGMLIATSDWSWSAELSAVGKPVDKLTLSDYRGKEHSLADYADKQAVVLAFIGTECPLAKLYGPRLAELAAEYEPRGVAFLAVDSNRQDSITEIAAYARLHGVKFPVLKDLNNELADRIGATRTPEVFVLDRKGVVRYQGRIDDQYGLTVGSNYAKPELNQRNLADALDQLLTGKEIAVPLAPATGCLIGRTRTADESSPVTYSNQIARILQNHCVECHRPGEIAPFSLTDYDEVVGWADMIEEVVNDRRMPPWHADPKHGKFANDRRLSDDEKNEIAAWVKNGAPEGDASQLPAPRPYAEGWAMPEPDRIVYMDDEPYTVPAEGVIDYQYFTVDPGFTEDKWVMASECRPGNRSVVHHIFVFVQPPGAPGAEVADEEQSRQERKAKASAGEVDLSFRSGGTRLISGTAPGVPPFVYPEGMAVYVPKGSKLIFQMHYTPNGTEQQDRSYVGLRFADPKEVKAALEVEMAINFAFQIPANADNHRVESWKEFKEDTLILDFTPHMHLRGKAFKYDLVYADGRTQTLLEVPRYDFNWQITYQLAEPLLVPAGTKMHCVAHFDNSEENLANPDPSKTVRWGDQTWEEMMIGWFTATTDLDYESLPKDRTRTADFVKEAAAGKVKVSKRLMRAASQALDSQKDFEILHRLVRGLCPQVDRSDVSIVTDHNLQFEMVAQPPILSAKLGALSSSQATVAVDHGELALAEYAHDKSPVVNNNLSESQPQGDLAMMARGVKSGLHIPVQIGNREACLNFWSREANAFPPEAVEALTELAQHLGQKEKTASISGTRPN